MNGIFKSLILRATKTSIKYIFLNIKVTKKTLHRLSWG